MIPFGMTGSKKLKDLFIDTKVPGHLRRRFRFSATPRGASSRSWESAGALWQR